MIDLDEIRTARTVLAGHVHETPCFSARSLGDGIWLKAELLQRTGSFKARGAFNRMLALTPEERERGVITVSAGNHAAAVALAGRETGTDALVLMARQASTIKVEATRRYGATVDLESADNSEALARMLEIAAATGRVIVHPFDDPVVMAGQGTIGLELVEQVAGLTQVVVPVGGGGLIGGIATAVKALLPHVRIVAVQPEATATLRDSVAAGSPQRRVLEPTLADALTPPAVGALAVEAATAHVDDIVHLSEREIAAGVRATYARTKLACEPAGSTPIAALLAGKVEALPGTVLVLSGGNVSPSVISRIFEEEP